MRLSLHFTQSQKKRYISWYSEARLMRKYNRPRTLSKNNISHSLLSDQRIYPCKGNLCIFAVGGFSGPEKRRKQIIQNTDCSNVTKTNQTQFSGEMFCATWIFSLLLTALASYLLTIAWHNGAVAFVVNRVKWFDASAYGITKAMLLNKITDQTKNETQANRFCVCCYWFNNILIGSNGTIHQLKPNNCKQFLPLVYSIFETVCACVRAFVFIWSSWVKIISFNCPEFCGWSKKASNMQTNSLGDLTVFSLWPNFTAFQHITDGN